jgi:hypothetical protein
MPGTLIWSVTFHGLRSISLDDKRRTSGSDPRVPKDLKERYPELRQTTESQSQEASIIPIPPVTVVPVRSSLLQLFSPLLTFAQPDPAYPSGILAISVLQIADLGFRNQKGSFGKRSGIVVGQESETSQTTVR